MLGDLLKRALDRAVPGHRVIRRGRSPHVFLTFDDGPHPTETPRILDVLLREGVRATFFVVGNAVREHPDVVRRIAKEGHTVGHHSFSHGDPRRTSASALAREAKETNALLEDVLGRRSRLFRPPRGSITAAKLARLLLLGQSVVFWSLDPRDYSYRDEDALAMRLASMPPQARDIVLLHDDNPLLANVLPAFVAMVRARGLDFRALPA